MSQFDDLFNYGMSVAEPYLQEQFTYNGSTYNGIFDSVKKGTFHMEGGYKNILNSTLVLRKTILPNEPVKGELMTKNGLNLQVFAVMVEVDTYVITLTEVSK